MQLKDLHSQTPITLRESFFIDDSTIFLKGTKENMEKTFKVLDLLCTGNEVKMNLTKSMTIWCSNNPRTWSYGEERGLKWQVLSTTTLNLGFPIGFRMSQQEKNARVLTQIQNKLVHGRILVNNQVILASIWYIASGADLAKSVLQKARTLIRNFVWGGDANKKI